jgi:glutathione peroxidase
LTDTNYRELVELYSALESRGFVVLAFPCNQFGAQEPGSAAEIAKFVAKYDVTFPVFAKVDVNGPNEFPLFKYLKGEKGGMLGRDIKWNFAKFLVGRDGSVLQRYGPQVAPSAIKADILSALDVEPAPAG